MCAYGMQCGEGTSSTYASAYTVFYNIVDRYEDDDQLILIW